MLNLMVREGDYLLIGDNIRIHVQKGLGRNMKLSVDAPRSVPVVRGSLYEKRLMEDPYENLEELEKNRLIRDDFKKDTERVSRKREALIAAKKREKAAQAVPIIYE